jgi:hypothetical protein
VGGLGVTISLERRPFSPHSHILIGHLRSDCPRSHQESEQTNKTRSQRIAVCVTTTPVSFSHGYSDKIVETTPYSYQSINPSSSIAFVIKRGPPFTIPLDIIPRHSDISPFPPPSKGFLQCRYLLKNPNCYSQCSKSSVPPLTTLYTQRHRQQQQLLQKHVGAPPSTNIDNEQFIMEPNPPPPLVIRHVGPRLAVQIPIPSFAIRNKLRPRLYQQAEYSESNPFPWTRIPIIPSPFFSE